MRIKNRQKGNWNGRNEAVPILGLSFGLVLIHLSSPVFAFEMSGAGVSLRSGSVNGGGTAQTAAGASGTTMGSTIAQSQPVGLASGASGQALHAGVWHALPEPGLASGLAVSALATSWLGRKRRSRSVDRRISEAR